MKKTIFAIFLIFFCAQLLYFAFDKSTDLDHAKSTQPVGEGNGAKKLPLELQVSKKSDLKKKPGEVYSPKGTLEFFRKEMDRITSKYPNEYRSTYKFGVDFANAIVKNNPPNEAFHLLLDMMAEYPGSPHMSLMANEIGRIIFSILIQNPDMAGWMAILYRDTAYNSKSVAQRKALIVGSRLISSSPELQEFFYDWNEELYELALRFPDDGTAAAVGLHAGKKGHGKAPQSAIQYRDHLISNWKNGEPKELANLKLVIKATSKTNEERESNIQLLLGLLSRESNTVEDCTHLLEALFPFGISALERVEKVAFGLIPKKAGFKQKVIQLVVELKNKPVK